MKKHAPKQAEQRQPGAYVVGGKLFFRLLDHSTLVCECIGEPYASAIVELFNNSQKK